MSPEYPSNSYRSRQIFSRRCRTERVNGGNWSKAVAKAHKIANNALSYQTGLVKPVLRASDKRYDSQAYQQGTILSAAFHTPDNSDLRYVASDDPNLTATPFGTIYSKYRKMVVVMRHGHTFCCLPIYTHNSRGLDGKQFLEEYVSIRDSHQTLPCGAAEGPHEMLWAHKYELFQGNFISGRSCIKLTEFYTYRYDALTTIEGELSDESWLKLKDLLAGLEGK